MMDPLDEKVKRLRRQETAREFDTQDKIKLWDRLGPKKRVDAIPFWKDGAFWIIIGGTVLLCVLSKF
jgi:hypothetical protein